MHSLNKNIDKSTRMIFRTFFSCNLHIKNKIPKYDAQWGVDLLMECNGKKRLSLYLEEDTLKGVMKRLTGEDDISKKSAVAYDIIGEMANLIVGNAIGDNYDNFSMSPPVISRGGNLQPDYTKIYSSNMGDIVITIENI